ncbi:hypothetical protein Cni_G27611 [Canna indica]|uniref:Uncharacterized protein n=1 Tax=Canna indica TaxID=4628 RepID=A0AAQ3L1F9_9LILI|nr:hypothetical protein Cni_G27611 [Canna indica]
MFHSFLLLSLGGAAAVLIHLLTQPAADPPPLGLCFDFYVIFLAGMAVLFAGVWIADGAPDRRARAGAVARAAERAAFRRRFRGGKRDA